MLARLLCLDFRHYSRLFYAKILFEIFEHLAKKRVVQNSIEQVPGRLLQWGMDVVAAKVLLILGKK